MKIVRRYQSIWNVYAATKSVKLKHFKVWENYVHVDLRRALNVRASNISYEKMVFGFFSINISTLLYFSISFVYCSFYSNIFFTNIEILPIKMLDLSKDIQFLRSYRLHTVPFIEHFFTNTKILPIKICLACPRIFNFSYQKC